MKKSAELLTIGFMIAFTYGCGSASFTAEQRNKCNAPLLLVVDGWAASEADSMVRVLVGVRDSTPAIDNAMRACGAIVTRLGPTFVGLDIGTKGIPCVAGLPGVQRIELDLGSHPLQ